MSALPLTANGKLSRQGLPLPEEWRGRHLPNALPREGVEQRIAGIWRHGRPTREGNLLIHQTATNRIIQVTPKQKAASVQ